MPKEYVGNATEAVKVGWDQDGNLWVASVTRSTDDGRFIRLDRSGVNRLIRVLRTARDRAFGADA